MFFNCISPEGYTWRRDDINHVWVFGELLDDPRYYHSYGFKSLMWVTDEALRDCMDPALLVQIIIEEKAPRAVSN